MSKTPKTERAVLAGGCFWGMQDLIRKQPGINSTRVGYTGGEVANATYRNHGNHAEGIEIIFDPSITSYRKILEFFFQIHDPSTKTGRAMTRALPIARRFIMWMKPKSGQRSILLPMSMLQACGPAKLSPKFSPYPVS